MRSMKAGMAQLVAMVLEETAADTTGCRAATTATKGIHRLIIQITLSSRRALGLAKRIQDKAHRIKTYRAQTKEWVMAKAPLDRRIL
jgi:hypothetical protein